MKNLNKIVTVLVIGGTLLSTSVIAMADTRTTAGGSSNFKDRPSIAGKIFRGGAGSASIKNNIENDLKSLVTAGIITQAESDQLLALSKAEDQVRQAEMDKVKNMTDAERKAYFESLKGQEPQNKGDIFAQAVSKGILTQAKADAAKAKLDAIRDADRQAKLTEGLKGLVTAGTITQVQADKVAAYINTLEASRPAPGTIPAQDKSLTPPAAKPDKNPLSTLVTNGTLTQEQLDAVAKVIPFGGDHGRGPKGGHDMDKQADVTSSATTAAGKTE